MNKSQIILLLFALALFLGLYLGFDTKAPMQKSVEKSRAIQGESRDIAGLADSAKSSMQAPERAVIEDLENLIRQAPEDSQKVRLLKNLSGRWYEAENQFLAAAYAEEAAQIENTGEAWSVAGASWYNGILLAKEDSERRYCAERAVKAFESAVSLDPEKVEHRVNLALVYAENPPPDNPMQAVIMLRELEQKHPESPSVFNALGRLAIKTGQWERAVGRLETALSLDPNNKNTVCLLAKAWEGMGNTTKAAEFANRCAAN